jgi:hypothetical protein
MMNLFKKATLATALAATALTAASPAMARDYYGYHHGDSTGAAIAGGIIGLALGAVIVSAASNHDHDRYRDRGWEYRDGYYWDRDGHRYDRYGRRYDDSDYYARRGYRDGNYGDGYYGNGYYRGY